MSVGSMLESATPLCMDYTYEGLIVITMIKAHPKDISISLS